ncbi:hypothetical protein BGW38_009359 [Lunasporangiospora selenospora]|uniref:Uncharacterized protein n=1 Tax=Lunasporangiospora selenospora TaxID=979761 RepID=A0A9P6FXL7_9FUNG|nr:hypothetical protein BGW38_009359 [Lunasporangiospora selenospora]
MPLQPALLKTLNLITTVAAITTIVLNRDFIKETYYARSSFLSNADIGLLIPAVTWFLLGGFSLVQWCDFAHDVVVEAIDYNLFISNLAIVSWVLSWRYDWLVVGELLLVLNAVLITRLYSRMRIFTATSILDYAFVHVSFSLYSGLVWLDVFQNFFAAFTTKEGGPMSWAALGAAFAIFILLAIAIYHAEFSRDPDSWSCAAVSLMILSISLEQGSEVPAVQMTGLVSFGWLIGSLARRAIQNVSTWHERANDEYTPDERRGLLG